MHKVYIKLLQLIRRHAIDILQKQFTCYSSNDFLTKSIYCQKFKPTNDDYMKIDVFSIS